MEINWKAKAIAPIEKEIEDLDKQMAELTLRKASFEKALSLFKGVAGGAPTPGKARGRRKKQNVEPPNTQSQTAA